MVNLTTSSEELRTQTLHELGIMGHFKITVRGISKEKKNFDTTSDYKKTWL